MFMCAFVLFKYVHTDNCWRAGGGGVSDVGEPNWARGEEMTGY